MRILLTGSSGYIGSQLIPHLKALQHTVVGFDRNAPVSDLLDANFQADLLDEAAVEAALQGVEAVHHLAAAKGDWGISADAFYRDNLETTDHLLRAGRKKGIKDWLFYSTVATLGSSEVPLNESAPFSPAIPYGASKAEAEKLFLQFAAEEPQARVMILRPSAVFGPGNPENTNIFRLIDAIYHRRFFMIGRGQAIKTTSFIDNLTAAHLFLMEQMRPGLQTFIYVDEPALSTGDLVARLYRLLNRRQPSWHLPLSVAKPIAYLADAAAALTGIDFPITAARIQKFCTDTNFDAGAIRSLGFRPPVDMDEALSATVDWHLEAFVHEEVSKAGLVVQD